MGIRALELARALRGEFDVRLLVANDLAEAASAAGDLPVVAAPPGGLAAAAVNADAAVVSGHAANWWFHQVPGVPVAADLYDPFFVENLHYASTLGDGHGACTTARRSSSLSTGPISFSAPPPSSVSSTRAPSTAGAASVPRTSRRTRRSRGSSRRVPFGVPAEPAAGDRAAGRRLLGAPPEGPLVLFGGIYDWYEPDVLLEAWPGVLRRCPDARLVFFENPNPETTPQRVYARTRERARGIDPAGKVHPVLSLAPLCGASRPLCGGGPARLDFVRGARERPRLSDAPSRRRVGRSPVDLGRGRVRSRASSRRPEPGGGWRGPPRRSRTPSL